MVDVCLLGTGGMMPLKDRWLTSCYIEYNGKGVLIDCGEGTQIAFTETEYRASKVEVILFTHFHADHISGLPGFLLSLGNYSKTTPLKIYGPAGIKEVVENLCCICRKLPFELEVVELDSSISGVFDLKEIGEMVKLNYIPLKHTLTCLGYSLEFFRKPIFNPEKAIALNIPKTMWKTLHSGGTVEFEGLTYTTEMVVDGERDKIKITYTTDSLPIYEISDLAYNSDLFICEGMYGDDENIDSMKKKGHMVFSDAAFLAKNADVKELWLTHYSPAMKNVMQYEKHVKKIFPNTIISRDGQSKKI